MSIAYCLCVRVKLLWITVTLLLVVPHIGFAQRTRRPRSGKPRLVQRPQATKQATNKPRPTTSLRHRATANVKKIVPAPTPALAPTRAEVKNAYKKLRASSALLKRSRQRASLAAKQSKRGRPSEVKATRARNLLEIYNSHLAAHSLAKADYQALKAEYQNARK